MFVELPTDIYLKPCPFCNGRAALYQEELTDYPGHNKYYVECTNDEECTVRPRTMAAFDIYCPKETAIKWWNPRGGRNARKTKKRKQ